MKKALFLFFTLFCSIVIAKAQAVQFTVSAPRVVNVNEQFRVTFSVNASADNMTNPDFGDFQILAGPSKSTSQNFQIINGQTSQSQTTSFIYILQATKEGKVNVGAASVVSDGKTYQSQPFSIEVVKGDASQQNQQTQQGQATVDGDAFVRVSVSKSNVYRGEYLIATVKLYTQFNINGFEDIKFPTFNGFWSQEIETPQQLSFQRETVDGKIYSAAVIRRYMLFPQQTGALKIEPFEITCVTQVQSSSARNIFDAFFSQSQLVRKKLVSSTNTVTVNELPHNAPASFSGAVGSNFRMTAELSHDSITANDAMSLKIKISGEGNVKLLEMPKVTLPPHFESYDTKISDDTKSSSAGVSGTKQFEMPFIPRSAGTFTISPVEFTYFDIAKKQYVTLNSRPLNIQVEKDMNVGSSVTMSGVNRQAVQSMYEDIRYIKTGNPSWREKGKVFFGSFSFYLLLALELVAFVAIYLFLSKRRKEMQNVVLVRNKKANKVARKRLKIAEQLLKSGNQSGFYEELTKALWGYMSDKLDIAVADLSRESTRETLLEKQIQETDIEAFLQTVDECEFARYAPSGGRVQMQKTYDDAMSVISKFEQLLR